MIGLIALAITAAWLTASILLARLIGGKVSRKPVRLAATTALAALLFLLPLADEIIGAFQFERLCKEAEDVKIYGTLPVGEELYTEDGKWRLGVVPTIPLDEFKRVKGTYDSLVRHESKGPIEVDGIIPIRMYERQIYSKPDGRLLASYRQYATSGGWLSRNLLDNPLVVRDQCFPPAMGVDLMRRIFPFNKYLGESK